MDQATADALDENGVLNLANNNVEDAVEAIKLRGPSKLTHAITQKLEDIARNSPLEETCTKATFAMAHLSHAANDPTLFEDYFYNTLAENHASGSALHSSEARHAVLDALIALYTKDIDGENQFTQPSLRMEQALLKAQKNSHDDLERAHVFNLMHDIKNLKHTYTGLDRGILIAEQSPLPLINIPAEICVSQHQIRKTSLTQSQKLMQNDLTNASELVRAQALNDIRRVVTLETLGPARKTIEDIALNDPNESVSLEAIGTIETLSSNDRLPYMFQDIYHKILTEDDGNGQPKYNETLRQRAINSINYLFSHRPGICTKPSEEIAEGLEKNIDPTWGTSSAPRISALHTMRAIKTLKPSYDQFDQAIFNAQNDPESVISLRAQQIVKANNIVPTQSTLNTGAPQSSRPIRIKYSATSIADIQARATNSHDYIRESAARDIGKADQSNMPELRPTLINLLRTDNSPTVKDAALDAMHEFCVAFQAPYYFAQEFKNAAQDSSRFSLAQRKMAVDLASDALIKNPHMIKYLNQSQNGCFKMYEERSDFRKELDAGVRIRAIENMHEIMKADLSFRRFDKILNNIVQSDPDTAVMSAASKALQFTTQNHSTTNNSNNTASQQTKPPEEITPKFEKVVHANINIIFRPSTILPKEIEQSFPDARQAAEDEILSEFNKGSGVTIKGEHPIENDKVIPIHFNKKSDVDRVIHDMWNRDGTKLYTLTQTGPNEYEAEGTDAVPAF